jgi:hypothetical protein
MQVTSPKPEARTSDPYQLELVSRIEECLTHGPQTLQTILRDCQGAYPTIVLDCVRKLSDRANWINLAGIALTNRPNSDRKVSILDSLEGNPVLCSWYFTPAACQRIGELRDWSNLRLAFLGTPRLYDWFRMHNLGKERLLLDLDQVVLDKLALLGDRNGEGLRYDVANDLPKQYHGRFDCVFFDPPWYPNDYLLWLSKASLLAPDGYVLFSLFPELTRPNARSERESVLEFVRSYTKDLTLISSFLDYEVPSYEFAQLAAAGLQSIQSWRVADLMVSRLTAVPIDCRSGSSTSSSGWTEIDIGSIRFFVGPAAGSVGESQLLNALSDGSIILASPSRREPGRQEANVLSSRGHGLATAYPQKLIALLESLHRFYRDGVPLTEMVQHLTTDDHTKVLLAKILGEV